MRRYDHLLKLGTTAELGVLLKGIGALITISAITSLFFVKSIGGALIAIGLPILYFGIAYLLSLRYRNALVINVLSFDGVRNESGGKVVCELMWSEIGDFGVAEVKRGLFKGKYVYMSRIFVSEDVRSNIIEKYDPRISIVFPYTEETAYALREASGEKIDLT